MRLLPVVLIVTLCLASALQANVYNSGSVLSNGGFEKGDLSEAANNGMGRFPWFSANSGGDAIDD